MTVLLHVFSLARWIPLGVGSFGLLCLAARSRHVRPQVPGPLYAGQLLVRPHVLTPRGRLLWAIGWLCVLCFNIMFWGRLIFL